jgi:DNA-binding XRE family transcriptional regulator
MSKALPKNLKEARSRKEWSQEQAARRIGIKQKTYAKYEEKVNPPWELMPVIMEAFGIKEEDMYPFCYNEDFFKK